MADAVGVAVERATAGLLQVTQDEEAVLRAIRSTPYGEVVTVIRRGRISDIRRAETIKPPSLKRQPKLPDEGEP